MNLLNLAGGILAIINAFTGWSMMRQAGIDEVMSIAYGIVPWTAVAIINFFAFFDR